MKKLLYVFLLLLICNNREQRAIAGNNFQTDLLIHEDDSSSFKKNMMKHNINFKLSVFFDIHTFNIKRNGSNYRFIDSCGREVRQWADYNGERVLEGYVDERMTDSGYNYRGDYNRHGIMWSYETLFYDAMLQRYDFDVRGNLIKFEDYDSLFKFSITNLIMMFRRDLNINILNTNICGGVNRIPADISRLGHAYYEVYIYKGTPAFHTTYLIHGDTGKMLFQQEGDFEGSGGDATTNYIQQKANKHKP